METKICIKCNEEKSITEFEFRKDRNTYRNVCRQCRSEQQKVHYKDIKEHPWKKRKPITGNSRICAKCGEEKDLSLFPKGAVCKECIKLYKAEYYNKNKERLLEKFKTRYHSNLEKGRLENKISYEKNRKKRLVSAKEYRDSHKESVSKTKLEWQKENKKRRKQILERYYYNNKEQLLEKQVKYNRLKYNTDPNFKLKVQIRNLIRTSFSRKKFLKTMHTEEIVGCDINFFINYLKETFKNNYGYEWDEKEVVHIDHIIPLSTVNTPEEVIKLCHYTNLQLLKGKDNLEKSDKLDWNLNN